MEVKPGYKRTEVGVIPEDWSTAVLGDVCEFENGDRGSNYPSPNSFKAIGVPFINAGHLLNGKISLSSMDYITEESYARLGGGKVKAGDTLFCLRGSLGKFGTIPPNFGKGAIASSLIIVRRKFGGVVQDYLSSYFSSDLCARMIEKWAGGAAQPNLGAQDLARFSIPLPPTEAEQRTIATALGDMDALLDGLDHLIAKKRAIKQATMQQLLTGQARLPGFDGKWEVKQLGDHLTFLKNGVNSRAELSYSEDVRYLHYGDIHGSSRVELNPANVEMPCLPRAKASRLDRLQNGDLIFADASEDMDGVGKSVEIQNATGIELVSGLHTIAIRFDKSVLADGFKAYIQFIPKFRAHLRQLAAGTKVYATNRTHISSVELRLPGIREQQAISSLLSDMDAEIAALATRRAKTRALKQAMMQELLTGRTRLVIPDAKPVGEVAAQTEGRKANVHFLRSVLAAEIIDQLHDQPTFGHVKFEKMMFLAEHLCQVDTGSTYRRKAAGPYDNRALRSIDSQLQKQQWFEARKQEGRYQYVPLAKRGGHKPYFERHFSGVGETLEKILSAFKTAKTEQCEIVATLLAAWSDLLREKGAVSDEMIVHEVLHNWHEAKQRILEDRWLMALGWMREKGFVPKGATLP
ncbi:restriction endonuclease subunit S [Achromobacter denitrificans]|uniref:restriction endonuclease subunit S n=1 Tax=Achromobacter denitrificans TaxID=32002 RepID=UPI00158315AE|nr:restriction endonuclease subunit S [Achromobacter denitrificans]